MGIIKSFTSKSKYTKLQDNKPKNHKPKAFNRAPVFEFLCWIQNQKAITKFRTKTLVSNAKELCIEACQSTRQAAQHLQEKIHGNCSAGAYEQIEVDQEEVLISAANKRPEMATSEERERMERDERVRYAAMMSAFIAY